MMPSSNCALNAGMKRKLNLENSRPLPSIPKRLWVFILKKIGIKEDKKWSEIVSSERDSIIKVLLKDEYIINGKGPFEVIRQSSQNDIPSLVLAGSVDKEVKRQLQGKFNKCDLLAFGRSDWTLEKNLLLARDQFTSSLQNYSFS
mgnify:CR=1 FL=1